MSQKRFIPGEWVTLLEDARRVQISRIEAGRVWVWLEPDWEIPLLPEELVPDVRPSPDVKKPSLSEWKIPCPESPPPKKPTKLHKSKPKSESTQGSPPPIPEDWTAKPRIPKQYDPSVTVPNKDQTIKKQQITRKKNKRPEIDLHLPALVANGNLPKAQEALSFQLNALGLFLELSKAQRHPEIVVIHGVGEGVLRQAVRQYIAGLHWAEAMDAPMRQYGEGATLVRIFGGG